MTGDIAAAGDIATGALIARAVDGAADGHVPGGSVGLCLNCGTARTGAFCHACGQPEHIHRTLGSLGHDLLHGVLHLEGRTWRTLPLLAFRPGELTRRYIAGERMRFVSPLAIFLFSVFLMFAVLGSLPAWNFANSDLMKPGVASGIMQARTKLAEERARAERAIGEERRLLARARAAAEPDPERIERYERRLAVAIRARDDAIKVTRLLATPTAGAADAQPEPPPTGWLDAKWRHAKENPELLLYKLKTSAYKYGWALIPISLPFIWLLFPLRRDVGMYDHAIFATYSLTFMSLLAIVLSVLAATVVPAWLCWTAAVFVPPFHLYKQLKGAYRLGRWGALWRLAWLLFFTSFTLVFFVMLLAGLSV